MAMSYSLGDVSTLLTYVYFFLLLRVCSRPTNSPPNNPSHTCASSHGACSQTPPDLTWNGRWNSHGDTFTAPLTLGTLSPWRYGNSIWGPPLSISAQCFETWDMTLDMEARRRCEYACEAMSATARGDFLANMVLKKLAYCMHAL